MNEIIGLGNGMKRWFAVKYEGTTKTSVHLDRLTSPPDYDYNHKCNIKGL